jgi:hypothetical protein
MINIASRPALTRRHDILAKPTLVPVHPQSGNKYVGTLEASDRLLRVLNIRGALEKPPNRATLRSAMREKRVRCQ